MGKRGVRSAGGLLLASAVTVGLAACGGGTLGANILAAQRAAAPRTSSPTAGGPVSTVSSVGFITNCSTNPQIISAVKRFPGGAAKVSALCVCVQKRLVAGGFGNRRTDDGGADIKTAGRNAGVACAEQVLAGG